jgi:serine/threonine protein kinase
VLLYELLHGKPPYSGGGENEKMRKIMNCQQFPFYPNISETARGLILKLMQKNPGNRISLRDVYKHPWILGFQTGKSSENSKPGENKTRPQPKGMTFDSYKHKEM